MTTLIPGELVHGLPQLTAWVAFTPSIIGTVADPTAPTDAVIHGYWRRVGDSMEIRYDMISVSNAGAAAGTGTYLLTIPGSHTIDSAKATIGSAYFPVGFGQVYTDALLSKTGPVTAYNSTHLGLWLNAAGTGDFWKVGVGDFSQTGLTVGFWAIVPITGWTV